MRNLKMLLSTYLVFLIACFSTSAQENTYNEVSIASPTAASLGKYADIPVNNHTGIPSVGIPIYTVEEGSLKLPISLSYHAGGIKVMEPASWVGTGWSLNAGGVITRSVRGAPDEKLTSTVYNQQYGYFSDYGYTSYAFYTPTEEVPEFREGKRDGEPDLFNFNVGGLSGKFYFRDDRTPVFEPQQDIKVEYDYTPAQGSIKSFILTGPDGTRYYFGIRNETNAAIPVERTNSVNGQEGYVQGTVISSWYLSKIESADRLDFIKLNYVAENYSHYTISMFPVSSNNTRMNWSGSTSDLDPAPLQPYEYSLIKNVINGVRLSEIIFSNGRVTFIPSGTAREDLGDASTSFTPEVVNNEAYALGNIKIENNGAACKKYSFSYDYFVDNTSLQGYFAGYTVFTDKKRLKLNSVQELSCDNTVSVPAHTFTYFTELLPRRLSFGQDHWGFYNGVSTNTKLIPTYTENIWTEFPGANRDPAWPAMRGGALQKISYPTGGYSLFDFEANDTWAESTKYNSLSITDISVGYTNPDYSYQKDFTFDEAPHTIFLGNTNSGGLATINVYDYTQPNSPLIATLSANPGESKQMTFNFPGRSLRLVISKNNLDEGYGASASFTKKIAYTYARNEMVGGLRIKTLTHNDGSFAPDMVTSFSYLQDSLHSSGVLYSRPAYVQLVRSDEIKEAGLGGPFGQGPPVNECSFLGCIDCDLLGSMMSYYKSPCGVRPLSTSQGNHIGYNQVRISKTGNGYSIYKYYGSDKWDAIIDDVAIRNVNTLPPCSLSTPSYPYPPEPLEPKRGELKYEGHFTEAGQKIKEADYTMDFAEETTTTPGRINGSYGTMFFTTYYDLKTIKKTSQTVVEKLYSSPTTYITTTATTSFESPYHYQPTKKATTGSRSETIESKYKYAADFRNSSCDAISDCYNSYATAVGIITSQYYQDKALCTTDGCIYNNYQAYRGALADARRDYLDCRKIYVDPTNSSSFAYCRNNAKTNAGTELKPIYGLQDENNFSPIEISEWKAGKLIKAVFNRFDYVTNPTGKVYADKTQAINLTAGSTSFTPASVSGNTIVKDSRYTDEAAVKFDGGNLVQLIKKDGVIHSYLWGYHSKYPVAKISNATYAEAKAIITNQALLDAPADDAALRNYLNSLRSITKALVSTYTYDPVVGITSETDPRGKTIYYLYDKLNRLVLIRDQDDNIIKKIDYQYQVANQQ